MVPGRVVGDRARIVLSAIVGALTTPRSDP